MAKICDAMVESESNNFVVDMAVTTMMRLCLVVCLHHRERVSLLMVHADSLTCIVSVKNTHAMAQNAVVELKKHEFIVIGNKDMCFKIKLALGDN